MGNVSDTRRRYAQEEKERIRIMSVAIGMMIFIFIVANVGGLYFYLQGRRHEPNL